MDSVIRLDDDRPGVSEREIVGGKARHLMACTRAGFRVPPGFTVTTVAYDAHLAGNGLDEPIDRALSTLDFADADKLESQAVAIRQLILETGLPTDVAGAIEKEYAALNTEYVAVRSSGTAEDMADASFAGQHDTYLDIRGTDAVLDAVLRCWASLWTTRAIAYRHSSGHDKTKPKLAVVVQAMVSSEVSGVMFTANPMTGATDEIIVNSSWGLGEGIVSGILNPDQFTLSKATLRIKDRVLGGKGLRVVRDIGEQSGTIEQETSPEMRSQWSLNDDGIKALGRLGRRVEEFYEGVPQDIEWALLDDQFYVLQSRDVTGVDLTWDEDVDDWQHLGDDNSTIWTRKFADEYWTGAVTPLFYSIRARGYTEASEIVAKEWGFDEIASIPRHKYHKAQVLMNSDYQRALVRNAVPKKFRAPLVEYLNSEDQAAAESWPFSWKSYARMLARVEILTKTGVFSWFDAVEECDVSKIPYAGKLGRSELLQMTDKEIRHALQQYTAFVTGLHYNEWTGWFVHAANFLTLLGKILEKWYDGENEAIFADLITGLPERTMTLQENIDLWDLAKEIRSNDEVRSLFDSSSEDEFFDLLAADPAGRNAHAIHTKILEDHGHRGHSDRDFYFPRRADDPALDYRLLKALLSSDGSQDPRDSEERLKLRRRATVDDVLSSIRRQPLSAAKVAAFNLVYDYVIRFMIHRDNERHYIDRATYAKKLAFEELGRRAVERGILVRDDDFYFLTQNEFYRLLDGAPMNRLVEAKIKGRREAFDRVDRKEEKAPTFLQDGREWIDPAYASFDDEASGVLKGFGTSKGTYTGTARVIRDLKDIGRIQEGDILVTNSTDPAWTPVFMVIGGLVLETGGMLAHGACLSREYNLPAVTVDSAIQRIEDGEQITVDGSRGIVTRVERLEQGTAE